MRIIDPSYELLTPMLNELKTSIPIIFDDIIPLKE